MSGSADKRSFSIQRTGAWLLARCLVVLCITGTLVLAGCQRTETVQSGFRGTGMGQVYAPSTVAATLANNEIPEPEPVDPPDPESPKLSELFKNVQVLNDLTALEFSRLMAAMSTWVAPEEGCNFCHNPKNLASDEKYPKVVARRMLQMTRKINTDWKQHVGATGVTCWTCHRGQAVPSGDWFTRPDSSAALGMLGPRPVHGFAGVSAVGNSSLPPDPLSEYLLRDTQIRVQGERPLAGENRRSIHQTRASYGLMIYMSNSLGVNCAYCHNTRALASWEESSPKRSTAWYGIRMVRDLNNDYLVPLTSKFPAHRLSAEGDGPKVGCQTCHKGSYKPLLGVSMLPDYPELRGVMTDKDRPAVEAPAATAPVAPAAAVKVSAASSVLVAPQR
jgi:photosynthetic reaction center cytochrome c subunit